MKRITFITLLICTIFLVFSNAPRAEAAPDAILVTFTFDAGDNNQATIIKTVGGVTMTLTNPEFGGVSVGTFEADTDGLYISADGIYDIDSFQISFDTPVAFQSYEISYLSSTFAGTFDLMTSIGSSTGNSLNSTGTHTFNSYLSVAAGDIITYDSTFTGSASQWGSITVLVPTTTTQSIGNGGASATIENVGITNNSTNACDFTVTHAPIPPGYGNPDNGEMPIQWDITTDGTCGTLDVDLVFNYTDTELGNGGAITEGNLTIFRHNPGGITWTNQGGTVNVGANTVTLTGVSALSDWTLGDATTFGNNDPTAVSLSTISANTSSAMLVPMLIVMLLLALAGGIVLKRRSSVQ